jgi:hypothetical protein
MAVVMSACTAMRRFLETVEEEASEHEALASRLRRAITAGGDDEFGGRSFSMPTLFEFLLAVTEEGERSIGLASRLRASMLKSIFGAGNRDQEL